MGTKARSLMTLVAAVACLAPIAACGGADPAEPSAITSSPKAPTGCAPTAGDRLVALVDDKKLQAANNIVPAVHARTSTPALLSALDRASKALTTENLLALNKSTDIENKSPKAAAKEFSERVKLTDGIARGSGGRIVIGASSVSESQTLAFLYEIVLTAAGFDARVQPVGSREGYEPELEAGDIHVVPEYLSTLSEFLNKQVNGDNAKPVTSGDTDRTYTALRGLGERRGLTFGQPAPATAGNGFAVTRALADKHGLRTLSDFAKKCSGNGTVLAGPPDCPKYSFCQPGLEQTYGLKIGEFRSLDAGGPKTKEALTGGTATLGLVFTSDAALAG